MQEGNSRKFPPLAAVDGGNFCQSRSAIFRRKSKENQPFCDFSAEEQGESAVLRVFGGRAWKVIRSSASLWKNRVVFAIIAVSRFLEEEKMAGRKRTFNNRPLKVIVGILIAVMVVLFIRYMTSPSEKKSAQGNTEAVRSLSVSPAAGTESGGMTSDGSRKTLEAVAAGASASSSSGTEAIDGDASRPSATAAGSSSSTASSVSASSSGVNASGNRTGENTSSVSEDNAADSSAEKGDTAVLTDGNGNTVTVTYDSGVAWYDANQNVYSPLGSGNWMDASGNIYTEAGSSDASGNAAGGGSGINLVQNRG